MTLGETIRIERNKMKLTQKEFASKIGISQTSLSQIECSVTYPERNTQNKIEEVFGTPLLFLQFKNISEADVPEDRRELFRALKPTIDDLINQLF